MSKGFVLTLLTLAFSGAVMATGIDQMVCQNFHAQSGFKASDSEGYCDSPQDLMVFRDTRYRGCILFYQRNGFSPIEWRGYCNSSKDLGYYANSKFSQCLEDRLGNDNSNRNRTRRNCLKLAK